MRKLIKYSGYLLTAIILLVGCGLMYLKTALPDVGPAPELTVEITQQRLERGEHLAKNVMACLHCHSGQNKNQFAHPADLTRPGIGGTRFGIEEGLPGDFYAPNLTPYHLGSWTDGELYRAITTGVSKDGRALFPIMPYPNYGKLDPEDIYSVIAYLRTLEPIANDVPVSEPAFPMNFIINTIPDKASPGQRPAVSDRVAYGKYLATAASCADCHTPREKGEYIEGMDFAGGNEFILSDKSIVRTANLTPDTVTGIGAWTEDAFLARFRAYSETAFSPHEVREGEFNTFMPWARYANMTDEELSAIYSYLRTLQPVKNLVSRFTPVAKKGAAGGI